eukprot:c7821_g1_i1.p1 GENE.c7821_g1_i1~~c7821_g1_i1.p1  ORF type:complete len:229 (+),score=57.39 c7821_g1_i1:29-715(+)
MLVVVLCVLGSSLAPMPSVPTAALPNLRGQLVQPKLVDLMPNITNNSTNSTPLAVIKSQNKAVLMNLLGHLARSSIWTDSAACQSAKDAAMALLTTFLLQVVISLGKVDLATNYLNNLINNPKPGFVSSNNQAEEIVKEIVGTPDGDTNQQQGTSSSNSNIQTAKPGTTIVEAPKPADSMSSLKEIYTYIIRFIKRLPPWLEAAWELSLAATVVTGLQCLWEFDPTKP